jgi:putative endonuclease
MTKNAQKDNGLQSQIGRTGCSGGRSQPNPENESPVILGAQGEAIAEEYLRRKRGFNILLRNWHNPYDRREEIDLVALHASAIVFVEVKTRRAGGLVPGYFAVGRRKRKALGRAVRAFLGLQSHSPRTYRFDVIEVELGAGPPTIRHFENVGLFFR